MTHAERQRRYRERHPDYTVRDNARRLAAYHAMPWAEYQEMLLRMRHADVQRRIDAHAS